MLPPAFYKHFNPRSREGSDRSWRYRHSGDSGDFNPRSREGSDGANTITYEDANISIHAPAREATIPANMGGLYEKISIHAPARGATSGDGRGNPASPDFNPRSREGSDLFGGQVVRRFKISIHAPARGATILALARAGFTLISIHAPARGATSWSKTTIGSRKKFQSTLPRGERLYGITDSSETT